MNNIKPKLKDIARRAGVSISMVSLVLNNKHRKYKIADATVAKVTAIAERLGYFEFRSEPVNANNPRLPVAIVTDTVDSLDDYKLRYRNCLSSMNDQPHFHLVCSGKSEKDIHRVTGIIERMMGELIGGVIVDMDPASDLVNYLEELQQRQFPLVIILNNMELLEQFKGRFNLVMFDKKAGAREAVQYAMEAGYRSFSAYLSHERSDLPKIDGILEAIRATDTELRQVIPKYRLTDDNFKLFEDDVLAFIRQARQNECLLFSGDTYARMACSLAQKAEKNIPGDIGIIGFGNTPISRMVYPALATVDQSPDRLADAVMRLMLKIHKNPDRKPKTVVIPAHFIYRKSLRQKIEK